MIRIGIDAMGGDLAPQAVVSGSVMATSQLSTEDRIVLVGKEAIIKQLLKQNEYKGHAIEVINAEEVIEMGEHPTKAISKKPYSSISIGFKLLKENAIDIFCGAGNTGAMHVGALFSVRAIEGISRPCIAGYLPQVDGSYSIMLDIGANADCKPEMLEQFGVIGSIFCRTTFGIENPKVALLNIGEEEEKGSLTTQAAYQLLKDNRKINFIGNIEGSDLFMKAADVIVTDGFTGNVVFKMGESLYNIAKSKGIDDEFINRTNYESIGGSPIVGINGNVMIAHGKSTPLAIANMIGWAKKQAETNAHVQIAKALN